MPTTHTAVQIAENSVIRTRLPAALRRSVSSPQVIDLITTAIQNGNGSVVLTLHLETPNAGATQPQALLLEGMTAVQFCKGLNGVNVMQVNQFLRTRRWLYNESKFGLRWRVASYARDRYMTERQTRVAPDGEAPFIAYTPVLLRKGAMRLYQWYLAGKLPMKKNWDGLHSEIIKSRFESSDGQRTDEQSVSAQATRFTRVSACGRDA